MTTDKESSAALKKPDSTQDPTSSRAFQTQCLDAAERFSEHLLSIMDELGETLYQMADQADDHELRRLYFTALQEVYSNRAKSKGHFKKQFLAALKAEIQLQPNSHSASLFTNAALVGVEQLTKLAPQPEPEPVPKQEAMPTQSTTDQSGEDQYRQMANTLPKGSWVEFHYPDAAILKARFTWVNPVTGVYLFIDRDGRKAPDRTPEALANAFRNGHASLIQDAAQLTRSASNNAG